MPSTKKRINLTVPDAIYQRLQEYKAAKGIPNDASACLQLIVQQLSAESQNEMIAKLLRENSVEQLMQFTRVGMDYAKEVLVEGKPDGEA